MFFQLWEMEIDCNTEKQNSLKQLLTLKAHVC